MADPASTETRAAGERTESGAGRATAVLTERADLDDGIAIAFERFGERVLMAFDPRQIEEAAALTLLRKYCPAAAGAVEVVHRTGT